MTGGGAVFRGAIVGSGATVGTGAVAASMAGRVRSLVSVTVWDSLARSLATLPVTSSDAAKKNTSNRWSRIESA